MVIALFGESCTGKSTIAEALKAKANAKVYSGKDYLRLAKNPEAAEKQFVDLLEQNVNGAENFIFVISEPEQMKLIPNGAKRVLVTANIDRIKERFAKRMGGKLPPPVEKMLEKKHGAFDSENCDLHINTDEMSADEASTMILA